MQEGDLVGSIILHMALVVVRRREEVRIGVSARQRRGKTIQGFSVVILTEGNQIPLRAPV